MHLNQWTVFLQRDHYPTIRLCGKCKCMPCTDWHWFKQMNLLLPYRHRKYGEYRNVTQRGNIDTENSCRFTLTILNNGGSTYSYWATLWQPETAGRSHGLRQQHNQETTYGLCPPSWKIAAIRWFEPINLLNVKPPRTLEPRARPLSMSNDTCDHEAIIHTPIHFE